MVFRIRAYIKKLRTLLVIELNVNISVNKYITPINKKNVDANIFINLQKKHDKNDGNHEKFNIFGL